MDTALRNGKPGPLFLDPTDENRRLEEEQAAAESRRNRAEVVGDPAELAAARDECYETTERLWTFRGDLARAFTETMRIAVSTDHVFRQAVRELATGKIGPAPATNPDLRNGSKPDGPLFPLPVPISQLKAIVGEEAAWLLRGYFARDVITLLVALWKAGKTTWLIHLLRILKAGGDFSGQTCKPADVLVVTEEPESLWAARRDKYLLADNVQIQLRPFKLKPGPADWLNYLDFVGECLTRRPADLVVLDTVTSVWPVRDENNAAEVQEALMPLRPLAAGRGLALFHHPSKSGGQEATSARGSGALPAFADIIIELKRVNPTDLEDRRRTLVGYGRYEATPKEVVIELREDGDGYMVHGDRRQSERARIGEVLDKILPSCEPGATIEELKDSTAWGDGGVRNASLVDTLRHGHEQGRYGRTGLGKRGNPFHYLVHQTSEIPP